MTASPLLEIRDLRASFPGDAGTVKAVDGISFSLARGQRLGLAGESGSGKTVTALSVMGLVSKQARISGEVIFDGVDLLRLTNKEFQAFRGRRIAMIFQNPLSCLNPAMKIGDQIAEAILAHKNVSKSQAKKRAVELLGSVGIVSPARNFDEYPHRFSGGMRQRVMIAIALSCEPELLIADEPTTALDVTIQAQILDLVMLLCEERGTAVILITHDLAVLARFAERIAVMYAGKLIEEADVDTIYEGGSHPYTWGLLTSITRLDVPPTERLIPIAGTPPSAIFVPPGCAFHPRCPYAQPVCQEVIPDLVRHPSDDHLSACHFAGDLPRPARLQRTGS